MNKSPPRNLKTYDFTPLLPPNKQLEISQTYTILTDKNSIYQNSNQLSRK